MKLKLSAISQRYVKALKKHLKLGLHASLQPALSLGRQAAALGLAMPELARIHERALTTLGLAPGKKGLLRRAEGFFAKARTPIAKVHRDALAANLRLNQLNQTLDRRSVDLAATNRSLKQSIAKRKTVERALRKSGGNCKKLLEESRRLQKHLQHLTHRILSAQEDKRTEISHNLQDEIAQTLLGINVRLLSLKKEAGVKTKDFKKDIASTQRLVEESVRSITRFARELNLHQPA